MLYGVFVGIDSYRDKRIGQLKYARADAEALYDLFERSLDPAEVELHLVLDEQACRLSVVRLIGEEISRRAVENDVIVLYFAGHGAPEATDSVDTIARYLVMHDSELDAIYSTGINLESDLVGLLNRLRAGLVMVLIDSCFSGRAGGRTFENPRLTRLGSAWRTERRLSDLDLGQGRIILSGADDDELAHEDASLQHGVFTHYVLSALSDPSYPAYTISAAMLYEDVSKKVCAYTNNRQHPVMNGRSRSAQLPHLAMPRS